jgi:vitamin B12 transporter
MKKIFAVTALFIGSQLQAQMVSQPQEDTASKGLNPVVVTANRFPQKQNTTGKVVTVITREVLSRSIGRTVPELLNQQAGITIIGAQNNLGTNQDVYLRGAGTGKTLILIDGMPAYDPSTISTAFDINHFPIDNIERIEIVRGALSTLYGSDAIAGVINIITKKGGNKPASLYSTLASGTYGTFKGVAGINGTVKETRYNLQYSRLQARGFSSAYDSTGTQGFDKDGFEQNNLSANLSTALTKQLQFRINSALNNYNTDLDAAAFQDERDFSSTSRNYQAGAGLDFRYNRGTIHFNYSFNNTKRNYLDDSTHVGGFAKFARQEYTGRSHVAEIYSNIRLSNVLDLLVGADQRWQNTDQHYFSVSSFGPYETKRGADTTNMRQSSFFATAFLKALGGFHLEIGGRYNHHSEYGNNFTYSFNPSYLINNKVKLFANIASAFKAPSLYQLFVVGSANNTTLQPETSGTIDGGVEYTNVANGFTARAVYFSRNIRNGIDYNYATFRYFNNNFQQDHGVELETSLRLDKFSFAANYTYVTGEVNTKNFVYNPATWSYVAKGDTTYNNLFRRPKHTVNVTLGFVPTDRWFISTHARFAGRRFEPVFMAAPIPMEAYQTVDIYTEYKFSQRIKAFADLKNITNEQFFDVRGYNSRRFNFMAGVNINL